MGVVLIPATFFSVSGITASSSSVGPPSNKAGASEAVTWDVLSVDDGGRPDSIRLFSLVGGLEAASDNGTSKAP